VCKRPPRCTTPVQPDCGACVSTDTCETIDTGAGHSAVNTKILAAFIAAQTFADCPALAAQVEIIKSQIFVPVMQGLYREAWEVDEAMIDVSVGHSNRIFNAKPHLLCSAPVGTCCTS
jgi:hypothetical protein